MRFSKERLEGFKEQSNKRSVTISNGNGKITAYNFSLLPCITCQGCNGCEEYCYAMKPLRYPSTQNAWGSNTRLIENPHFVGMMIQELSKLPEGSIFRIHQSGDFVSQEYIDKWTEIIEYCTWIDFYYYTKVYNIFDFERLNSFDNVSSVASTDSACKVVKNFDKIAIVDETFSNCGEQTQGLICGETCTNCSMKNNGVTKIVFKKH